MIGSVTIYHHSPNRVKYYNLALLSVVMASPHHGDGHGSQVADDHILWIYWSLMSTMPEINIVPADYSNLVEILVWLS